MLSSDHSTHRIVLIHALPESVQPIHAAFQRHWPGARYFDLLDSALSADLATEGTLSTAICERFLTLGRYAAGQHGMGGRTAGILFTCSAFGPAIDGVKAVLPIPVLRPNEAAFSAALKIGHRIALLVTFEPSCASLNTELLDMAAANGQRIELETRFVDGALSALQDGDVATHDWLIAEAAKSLPVHDVLILGQFSMARAAPSIPTLPGRQVITTPDAAVLSLRHLLHDKGLPHRAS
jgi:Asp/Glu/hydantoin racemase